MILTQPYGYLKKKNLLLPFMKLKYPKYRDMVQRMANRHLEYNETLAYIEQQEAQMRLLVIRPDQPLKIRKAEKDPEELKRVYEIGRSVAIRRLDEIKAYLSVEKQQ